MFPGLFWGAPGGDFTPAILSSQSIGDVGTYVFPSSPTFVAITQFYLDFPAQNFGYMVRGDEATDASAKRFATKEYPASDLRPTLIVDYTPPGTPAAPSTWGAVKGLYR